MNAVLGHRIALVAMSMLFSSAAAALPESADASARCSNVSNFSVKSMTTAWMPNDASSNERCLRSWLATHDDKDFGELITNILRKNPNDTQLVSLTATLSKERAAAGNPLSLDAATWKQLVGRSLELPERATSTALLEHAPKGIDVRAAIELAEERAASDPKSAHFLFKYATEKDPESTLAVLGLADLFLVEERVGELEQLCQSLVSKGRALQAKTCFEARPARATPGATEWLKPYAELPLLSIEEIDKSGNKLPGLDACRERPPQNANRKTYRANPPLRFSAITLTKLADSVARRSPNDALPDEFQVCLRSHAAWACIGEVTAEGSCSDSQALGNYAVVVAPRNRDEWANVERELFDEKANLYALETRAGRSAVFHMHIVLAHVYAKIGDGPQLVQTVRYHAGRAQQLWVQLQPGLPFPAGMLPQFTGHGAVHPYGVACCSLAGRCQLATGPLPSGTSCLCATGFGAAPGTVCQ